MKQYLDQVQFILDNGELKNNRTGVDSISYFGTQVRYDLRDGFPILTTRKVPFINIVRELLWILRGESNIKTLECSIWNSWSRTDGSLGPIYGHQLRFFKDPETGETIDQIQRVLKSLQDDPYGRRHIMTTFNPADADRGVLWPCHGLLIQFNCTVDGFLDLHMVQRSCDAGLGQVFNIAEYALLLMLFAKEVNREARYLIHSISDHHIYENHIEGLKEQLTREPRKLPRIIIADKPLPYPGCPRDGSVLEPGDVSLKGYDPWPALKFEVAV